LCLGLDRLVNSAAGTFFMLAAQMTRNASVDDNGWQADIIPVAIRNSPHDSGLR
jgi:hypothetical protein